MRVLEISSLVTAATAAALSSSSTFNAAANTNLAVYWGQGAGQQRLSHFCEDSNIDIIPISFLNVFPDQGKNGYPGTNFGNQCGDETYKTPNGGDTQLLSNCALIGPDIKTCQALGKKLLLSLGGAIPTDQSIDNDESAVKFANFLWSAFGPVVEGYDGPRPFGDAVIDGFDFDIENQLEKGQDASALYRGYATMITTLRGFYALDKKTKDYFISGAPQCVVPDAHLADAIEKSWFDFLFVQFYNTEQCSARAFFDHTYGAYGGPPTNISFDAWAEFVSTSSMNRNAKIYLGLPAAPAITFGKMYLQPDEAAQILKTFQCKYPDLFGGAMIYEATASETNSVDGLSYADAAKNHLKDSPCAPKSSTTSTVPSSTLRPTSTAIVSSSSMISSAPTTTSQPTTSAISSSASLVSSSSSIAASSTRSASSTISSVSSSMSSIVSVVTPGTSSITPSATPSSSVLHNSSSYSVGSTPSSSASSYGPSSGFSASPSYIPSGYNYTATYGPTASQSMGASGSSAYPTQVSPSNAQHNSTTVHIISGTPTATIVSSMSSEMPTGPLSGYPSSSGFPYLSSNVSSSPTYRYPPLPTTSVTSSASLSSYQSETRATSSPAASPVMPYSHTTVSPSATPSEHGHSTAAAVTNPNGGSPASYTASAPEITTTEIVTSYTTTCPVTNTVTEGGATHTQTSLTVSVVYSTITSTMSNGGSLTTNAAPTPEKYTTEIVTSYTTTCPVTNTVTEGGATHTQTSLTVSVVYSTITSTMSNGGSLTTNAAPTPEKYTTEIITSYTTTCPVTHTATYGEATYTHTSLAISLVYSTITSTMLKIPEATASTVQRPHGGAHLASHASNVHGHGSPKHQGNAGAEGANAGLGHSSPFPADSAQVHGPVNAGSEAIKSPQQQHGVAPLAASSSMNSPHVTGNQGPESPQSQSASSGSESNHRYGVGSTNNAAQGAVAHPAANAPHGSAGYGAGPVSSAQSSGVVTKLVTATKIPIAASPSSVSAVNAISEGFSASAPLVTQTTIPAPENPGQYNQAISSAPFPSGNGTSNYGASASGTLPVPSASVSGASSAAFSSQPSPAQFTGEAARPFVGTLCAIGAAVCAMLVL